MNTPYEVIALHKEGDGDIIADGFPDRVAFDPRLLADAAGVVLETLITIRVTNGTATYRVVDFAQDTRALVAEKVSGGLR